MNEFQVAFAMALSAIATSPGVPSGAPMPGLTQTSKVWISKPSGALQCEKGKGQSLASAKRLLTDKGIRVYKSKVVVSAAPVIALCGASTGENHSFLIGSDSIERAVKLGFSTSYR